MPGAEERRGGAASSTQPQSDPARSRRRVKGRLGTVSFVDGRSRVPDLRGFACHSCPVGLPAFQVSAACLVAFVGRRLKSNTGPTLIGVDRETAVLAVNHATVLLSTVVSKYQL